MSQSGTEVASLSVSIIEGVGSFLKKKHGGKCMKNGSPGKRESLGKTGNYHFIALEKIPGHISHRTLSFYMFKFYVLNFGGV